MYNYRETTGEKPAWTEKEARGYIEGYTQAENENLLHKKTPEQVAKMMESRKDHDQDNDAICRREFDSKAYEYGYEVR